MNAGAFKNALTQRHGTLIDYHCSMSLRELYQHLFRTTQQYQIEDGRHLLWRWRRASEVHAAAVQYLVANGAGGSVGASGRAVRACQDLVNLRLMHVQENLTESR